MVQLERVKRQHGARVLFEELSWKIASRARIGLVGPNGAGKTTLLRILAGLETPDGGAVHKPKAARIDYLPQEVETVRSGTVLEVVLAGAGELCEIARQLEQRQRQLAELVEGDVDADRLADSYGELLERFEALGGNRLETSARTILSGLGVPESRFQTPLTTLSGGWRMRVMLARLLLGRPELLLLDEPTNHLDLEAIDWLEQFLSSYDGSYIIVSHDRYFLNRMVERIVELEHGRLTEYAGAYDDYVSEKQRRSAALEQSAKQQAREIAKVERFIERFRYKNTKAKQVQSRVRALDKLERVRTAADSRGIRFGFPPTPRSGDIAYRLEGVTKRYGAQVVYEGLDLILQRGDRLALVGANGAGKSTLLKLLAREIPADAGALIPGENIQIHYYAQHQLEALDPEGTPLSEMQGVASLGQTARLRSILGGFLFSGEDVDKKVAVLSGGEKARLALAKMLVTPANLLLLDEPTNHLDLASRAVIEAALDEYQGSLVVVSHDRYFINRIATRIGAVGGGRLAVHEGAYDEYLEWKQLQAEADPVPSRPYEDAEANSARLRRESRRLEAEERNRNYRERKRVEATLAPLEQEIATLEQRDQALAAQQADPAVYSDPQRAGAVGRERTEIESRLAELYVRWETLATE